MNLLDEGFALSLIGLATTFTGLGLFVLIIVVLRALFPGQDEVAESRRRMESAPPSTPTDPKVAAAIAVALRRVQSPRAKLGAELESGPGPYWHRSTPSDGGTSRGSDSQ